MVIMEQLKTAQQVVDVLGQKFPKGKSRGEFPAERSWTIGDESQGMKGLIPGSRQTTEQEYVSRAEGREHRNSVSQNPEYYNGQP